MSKYLCSTIMNLRYVIIALVALLVMSFGSVAKAAETGVKGIRVIIDGNSTYYETSDKTVGEFLANNNIKISEDDIINVDMEDEIKGSMRIVIDTPFDVLVSVDGGKYEKVETNQDTVGKLIVEMSNDEISYQVKEGASSSTKLEAGMKIDLLSVTSKVYTKSEVIPFETRYEETDELYVGETNVAMEGVNGEKTITMKTIYVAGEPKQTFSIDSEVTLVPVDKLVKVGTKAKPVVEEKKPEPAPVAETGGIVAGRKYSRVINMKATAYCPCAKCCGKYSNGITASGMKAGYGVVAVDKRVIPLGTKLYVPGYGFCVAADTGSAIKGNRIDLCYGSHSAALASGYGHTPTKVYVLA